MPPFSPLRGRFLVNERTPADLNKAAEFFRLSLAEDPAYAQPYAGLADALILLVEYDDMPPREAMPQAEKAALRAVADVEALHGQLGGALGTPVRVASPGCERQRVFQKCQASAA